MADLVIALMNAVKKNAILFVLTQENWFELFKIGDRGLRVRLADLMNDLSAGGTFIVRLRDAKAGAENVEKFHIKGHRVNFVSLAGRQDVRDEVAPKFVTHMDAVVQDLRERMLATGTDRKTFQECLDYQLERNSNKVTPDLYVDYVLAAYEYVRRDRKTTKLDGNEVFDFMHLALIPLVADLYVTGDKMQGDILRLALRELGAFQVRLPDVLAPEIKGPGPAESIFQLRDWLICRGLLS